MTHNDIPGYCDYHYFYRLISMKLPKNAVIAEVGVWLGHSVIFMAELGIEYRKDFEIYAIDTFKGSPKEKKHQAIVQQHGGSIYKAFIANVSACGMENAIEVLEVESCYAPGYIGKQMDFVFLDADHEYNSVKADIQAWLPFIKPGGILAGHDYTKAWPGVVRAVDELLPTRQIIKNVWMYEKPN